MMLRLIWRNLWRNPRRTWITTSSIAFAVLLSVLMQSFQKGVFDYLIQQVVGYYTGHLQVHREGYWVEPVIDNVFPLTGRLDSLLSAEPRLAGSVPRLETFLLASTGTTTKGCLLIGTDPEREEALIQLRTKLVSGTYFFTASDEGVILAEGLAERLQLREGDTLVLLGQGYHAAMAAGRFPIRGMAHFASPDLNQELVFLPLSTAQTFLDAPGMLSTIALSLRQPSDLQGVQTDLSNVLPVGHELMTWEELMPEISGHIKGDRRTTRIYSGILYLIISFGFFGTVMMMTAERRYEFGMLTAIGMSKRRLGLVLFGETVLLTLLGAVVGLIISLPGVWYFTAHPIRLTGQTAKAYEEFGFSPLFPATLSPDIFINQSIIVSLIALVVGMYPLWHIRRMDPIRAMHSR